MFYRSLTCIFTLTAALLGAAEPALASDSQEVGEAKKYRQVQDLVYGVALYDYFQGNYFNALSTLLVGQERDVIHAHRDNAALIEGGISLVFGLEQRAAELFEQQLQLSEGASAADVRHRKVAWQKLAELSYLQGNWALAEEQLRKSGDGEESALALNLMLQNNDFSGAEPLLETVSLPLKQRVLGNINMAAALAREGHLAAAIVHYHEAAELAAAQEEGEDEELLVLADKAHIGAGYAYALRQRHDDAAEEFRQVRLLTPWATSALLGLSWSTINSGQYQSAIDALQFLIKNQGDSEAAREAMVALPYSYEKLERPGLALAAYRRAERHYRSILIQLQLLQDSLESVQLASPGEAGVQRYGWLQLTETPELLRDNRRYLQQILQSDKFHLRLSELRDLRQLAQVIERWQQKLPQFAQLNEERRRIITENYQSAQFDLQLEISAQKFRELEQSHARIEDGRDALAPMTVNADEGSATLSLLRRAEQRYRVLADLVARREVQLDQMQVRLAAAVPELSTQYRAITRASSQIDASIRRDVLVELHRERAQVRQYMAHTQLAIARLQDAAMQDAAMQDAAEQGMAERAEAAQAGDEDG